ncbi:unnamed protein product [Euphydryas editha]|uniref:THAP-type domain-containing protein n=1 Tax=Euphydryas editha TaxID=104508 RepID=A0AAU9TGT7_EUPED|nr:unnamed protein product [Euphydryas editha]
MERKKYRCCAVPQCTNTSKSTPNKIFIDVPRKADIDHFDLPNDMENYMRYHVIGTVGKVMLKHGSLPTKFQCQSGRKRSLPSTVPSRPAAIKRQRLALVQEALEDSKLGSDTKEVNTTLSLSSPVEVIVEHQPKNQNKGIQVFMKITYFRSKLTQTEYKSHSIATSPSKTWTTTVSTSPFKVEHVKLAMPSAPKIHRKLLVDRSDSDTSLCSVQPINISAVVIFSPIIRVEITVRRQ